MPLGLSDNAKTLLAKRGVPYVTFVEITLDDDTVLRWCDADMRIRPSGFTAFFDHGRASKLKGLARNEDAENRQLVQVQIVDKNKVVAHQLRQAGTNGNPCKIVECVWPAKGDNRYAEPVYITDGVTTGLGDIGVGRESRINTVIEMSDFPVKPGSVQPRFASKEHQRGINPLDNCFDDLHFAKNFIWRV